MQVYQRFHLAVVSQTFKFIKKETPTQVFPCEICEFFQPATLLKTTPWQWLFLFNFVKYFSQQLYQKRDYNVFLIILRRFSACNFIKNKIPTEFAFSM